MKQIDQVVSVGDVWRRNGPCDWVKVTRIEMPENINYDGGLAGCSIIKTNSNGNWKRKPVFFPARTSREFNELMVRQGRMKVK